MFQRLLLISTVLFSSFVFKPLLQAQTVAQNVVEIRQEEQQKNEEIRSELKPVEVKEPKKKTKKADKVAEKLNEKAEKEAAIDNKILDDFFSIKKDHPAEARKKLAEWGPQRTEEIYYKDFFLAQIDSYFAKNRSFLPGNPRF